MDYTCCGVAVNGEIPEGAIPLEALSIVKYVGADGVANLTVMMSPRLAGWEVTAMADFLIRVLQLAQVDQS